MVSGESYVLAPFQEGNLYLVREDGTIYRSPYFVSEEELRSFQNLLNVTGWSDILECARKSLDSDRLDKESRKFLEVD